MKQYVADIIGDEYKMWKEGDTVIITTPTGSGKTSFVLSKLLQQAVEEDMHVLYLCNRKVLSEQFREQSKEKLIHESGYAESVSRTMLEHIHVFTYQYYEARRTFPDIDCLNPENENERIAIPRHKIKYYIFDEAHYFLGDALFNSNTNYWFDQNLARGISVFLTATPKLLEFFLVGKHRQIGFHFLEHAENIYRITREKRRMRTELSRKEVNILFEFGKGVVGKEEIPVSQSYIREVCREINPYTSSFKYIDSAHSLLEETKCIFCPDVNVQPDYSRYDLCYFCREEDITQIISEECKRSNEKWLVFIDSTEKGLVMETKLRAVGFDAVFLSEQRIKEENVCRATYHEIINAQQYTCQVLIATPVLDCGINIMDKSVKNVVLFQHDYTTFIQSLGRRRLHEGERINLFIRVLSSKTIEYHCRVIEKKLDYISMFCLKDTGDVTGSSRHHVINTSEIEKLKDNFRDEWTRGLVYRSSLKADAHCQSDIRQYQADRRKYNKSFFPEWQFSKTAFLRLAWNLQDYYAALVNYYNTGDDFFFLKHQLHWINREFNIDCLLGYSQKVREIDEFLNNIHISNTLIRKGEQKTLSKKFLDMLLDLPIVLPSMKKDVSRYRKAEMVPKKKKLNTIFKELELPYFIKSIRKKFNDTGKEETCWVIEKCNI